MAGLFGDFNVRIDPWEVDYGSQTPLESISEEAAEDVATDVEVPSHQWKAVIPQPAAAPEGLWFVDGVRRLETRLMVRRDTGLCHGAFGSFAVGCVQVRDGEASFGPMTIGRQVVLGSNQQLPCAILVRDNLLYEARSAKGPEPDAPLRAIQGSMRDAEGQLARQLSENVDCLVIADGPLSFESSGRGTAVGLIKRITELYLPSSYVPLLISLPFQSRTPLFRIRARKGGFARLAWYIRLAEPFEGESELHGLARLEVREAVGVPVASALADLTAFLLPPYAPSGGRDPRSPQNLLPIGALEQRLRHTLGDPLLIRRWIRTLVAKETAHDAA